MKSIASLVTLALFATGVAAQSTCTINTPGSVSECIPTLLSWTGGSSPYYLLYGPLTGDSFSWTTNITQGTYISLTLRDSTGAACQSAPFSINAGNADCLAASASSSASSAASTSGASATSSGASSSAASTSGAASSSASSASSASASHSSAASPSASSHSGSSSSGSSSATSSAPAASHTSGAGVNEASLGLAGVVGAILAAVLV
ncbi:hypothetical protein SCP_1301900 [Sparassis crispa]|uniref:Uncharacterized protein n=1 Tax=Sparassis crispa TaxID=139825 RepID=A0A401H1R7_9APHY|nr:hypothetical protein SCP_1301900 [Sparassis crispa]GBE88375.1 hypothetical protein SCP_1301900 [Sparassis crispa]